MINQIEINNFKSHKNTTIECRNLTVLCGSNGVGKSSLIQALLLLRESFLKDKSFDILDLKSNPVKIGNINDAIYENGDYDGFEIKLEINKTNYRFYYDTKSENEKEKSFIKLNKEKSKPIFIEDCYDKSLFNESFQYISAARKGPQESYSKDSKIVDIHKQISLIEGQAEYFVHFLDTYGNNVVIDELCLNPESNSKDLYSQVGFWQKYIFEGANTEVQDIGKLGFVLKFSFDNEHIATKKTKSFDAKNVGFGLTYTLPILVAILSSKKEALIIIENPEAHLHPKGISKLTELLCKASQAGIQIVIETHSDHIINGILVQSKKFEETTNQAGIYRENVSIYQFFRSEKEHSAQAKRINIEENGRIYDMPPGFFDQIDIDLRELF